MPSYWVTFRNTDVKPVCVDSGNSETARFIAQQHAKTFVNRVQVLPYPATPRINTVFGSVPCFCYTPERCAGKTSCPHDISCVE